MDKQTQIAPLRDRDVPAFVALVRSEVSVNYPGTEDSYALDLARQSLLGFPSGSPFTVGREIWTVIEEDRPIGFVVCSKKLGGSIKIGPIVVDPERRRSGHASQALTQLEEIYAESGYRRLFLTAPEEGLPVIFLAQSLGFTIEARLRRHFRAESDELVLGKLLTAWRPHEWGGRLPDAGLPMASVLLSRQFFDLDGRLHEHLGHALAPHHRLMGARERQLLYVNRYQGGVFLDMKRGGAVRIGPIFAPTPAGLRRTLNVALDVPWVAAARRRFLVLPESQFENLRPDLVDFNYEGLLRVPYSPIEDALVLGQLHGNGE